MMMRMRVIIDDAVEIHVDWDYLTGLLTTLTAIIYSEPDSGTTAPAVLAVEITRIIRCVISQETLPISYP